MIKITKKALKSQIFDKVQVSGDSNDDVYRWLEELMTVDTKAEYTRMYSSYDVTYIQDDKIKQDVYKDLSSQQVFKQKILLFWTGSRGILNQPYSVYIINDIGSMIKSHTCFSILKLPTSDHILSKQMLFDKLMEMFIGGLESGYSDR
jgi:hypothetical protein